MQPLNIANPRACRNLIVGTITRTPLLLLVVAAIVSNTQRSDAETAVAVRNDEGIRRPLEREVIYEGMVSYGNYRVFGAAENAKLYTAGVEYDRELWPRVLGTRVDYVAEFLPVVLLTQPLMTDIWGNTLTRRRDIVPGVGVTPIGFRLLWRDGKRVMPYFETKGGVLAFTQKALSSEATYENWSFHLTGGAKIKLAGPYDLRLGLISDLHFSDAFIVRSNPALDVMNVDIGIVYHLHGSKRGR